MPSGNPNIKDHAVKFSSTYQPNNTGRKKNRFKEIYEKFEFSKQDNAAVLEYLLSLNIDELKDISQKKDVPALMIAYASALVGAIKQGKLQEVNSMLDRLHGKAKENIDLTGTLPVKIIIKPHIKEDENTGNNSTGKNTTDI